MKNILLEICIDSLESAKAAIKGGADRLEVCSHLELDGLTPTVELVKQIKEISVIPQYIMIRPREGDFNYSEEEFGEMKSKISAFKEIGVQGFVSGILTDEPTIDKTRTAELMNCAEHFPFTFHRAFDTVLNQNEALDVLIDLGVETVLTSGGKPIAYEGMARIKTTCRASKRTYQYPCRFRYKF